ncbi:hypothetical protein B0H16DRAFT_1721699 [Mycena metata]|uniref:Uncharacterized protein n=1 Tax=Mycena metata TaxID=1033252 RepID=A0AAD7J3Z7_9AGAR|nr:hypothetical protein B0H16DRAFT_1721699 [Mycena metata]
MLASIYASISLLVVRPSLILLSLLIVPVAARRLTGNDTSHIYFTPLPADSSPEHGLTTSHTTTFPAVLPYDHHTPGVVVFGSRSPQTRRERDWVITDSPGRGLTC